MSTRHQIRELALQALYQYDARGEADAGQIAQSILDAPHVESTKQQALELAKCAWTHREQADGWIADLSPDWPTNRQPVVDRNILRLACYEMAGGIAPPAVVIDEAIELAKTYGSERSPAFINGVLDKVAQRLADGQLPRIAAPKLTEDQWLSDALKDTGR